MTNAPSERRKISRIPCSLSVDVMSSISGQPAEITKGRITNASLQGMCLLMPQDVSVGTQVGLVIYHDGYDSICMAEVVWKDPAASGVICGLRIQRWTYLDRTLQDFLTRKR